MRIKFNFTPNTEKLKVNNQDLLNSYIHKCLGRNNPYHDSKSNYSISHLCGGRLNEDKQTLTFKNGSFFIVTSNDQSFINQLLIGVMNNQDFIAGMRFCGVDYVEERLFDGWNYFVTLSPFIVKQYTEKGEYSFLTLNDVDFEKQLKSYLINKLSKIEPTLDLSDFDVSIPHRESNKVKKILVKNVINVANKCHINIYTNKRVAEVLYNIGIGQSSGSGFGTIYKTENHDIYKAVQD